jgi:transposase
MPQGIHFSYECKEIFFRVIEFIENEKNGPCIPMNNTTARLTSMLGISESSLFNLKKEMKVAREMREMEEEEEEEGDKRSRLRLSSSQILPTKTPHKKQNVSTWSKSYEMSAIRPKSPRNIPGPSPVYLSEEADDEIRFQFHVLLSEKIYPTLDILLDRLLTCHTDFPVRSRTTLYRHMHRLGFSYKMTNKVKVALDDNSFVAQRAFYFRKLDELRECDALIMFHDETWVNTGEEKRSIWIDNRGRGRLRKTDGKGNKLISISSNTFFSLFSQVPV